MATLATEAGVTQRAEEPRGRVHEGQGADARHGVSNPGSQLVFAIRAALGGLGGHLSALIVPDHRQFHLLAVQVLEDGLDFLDGVHLGVIDVGDHVPFLQAAGPGGGGHPFLGGDV